MNINDAKKAGALAYQAGEGRRPSGPFVSAACAVDPCNARQVSDLLGAYLNGWDYANLADGCEDLAMPSVIELARILA